MSALLVALTLDNGRMARHRLDDPVNEHTQLGADVPLRRERQVFIVDLEKNFEKIWRIVPEYWGNAPYPTATAIGVTWLTGFQFEIKVTAKLPAGG